MTTMGNPQQSNITSEVAQSSPFHQTELTMDMSDMLAPSTFHGNLIPLHCRSQIPVNAPQQVMPPVTVSNTLIVPNGEPNLIDSDLDSDDASSHTT